MEITLDKKSAVEGVIKINLVEEDYAPLVQEKIKNYSKKAQIKGFRAGKVPTGYIKKLYGKSILVDEINHLVSQGLGDYIRESDLNILGEPLPVESEMTDIDWDTQKTFDFSYEIGFIEDLGLKLDKQVKVNQYDIEVREKDIKETIDSMKKRAGTDEDVEKSEAGDIIYGKLVQKDGEIDKDAMINTSVIDGRHRKKFLEKKVGDTIEFEIEKTFKDEKDRKMITGLSDEEAVTIQGKFSFTIEQIQRKIDAELNQKFFDNVFGKGNVKDEKEFEEKIKKMINANYEKEADNILKRDIIDKLVEKLKVELPEAFLKKWLLLTNKELTEEILEKEFSEYLKELKWNLIFTQVRDDEKIEIEYDEVREKAKELLIQQLGQTPELTPDFLKGQMDGFADNYLQAEEGKNLRFTQNIVLQEKVLDIIREKITIGSTKTDWDKFLEKVTKK